VNGNFKDIDKLAIENGFNEVDGIVYDLGYSLYQLGEEDLGISFLQDQTLDMRMSKDLGVTAADLVNALSEKELSDMFYKLSDERLSRRFAKAIVSRRNLKKFQTTKDLADLLADVAPPGYEHGRIHPATRVFQALRIAVNSELENLEVSLPRAARILLPGGRMAVISFHSLEDKLVKEFGQSARPYLNWVTDKPLVPTDSEVENNSRSRSAKLRVFEKIAK
jgi:16S rRNA (cytosine1402-N4)-methyltransferase